MVFLKAFGHWFDSVNRTAIAVRWNHGLRRRSGDCFLILGYLLIRTTPSDIKNNSYVEKLLSESMNNS